MFDTKDADAIFEKVQRVSQAMKSNHQRSVSDNYQSLRPRFDRAMHGGHVGASDSNLVPVGSIVELFCS